MKWEVYMYQIFLISTTRDKINMNTYKITKTENYEVALNNNGDSGYFEHLEFGDMQSGGLWLTMVNYTIMMVYMNYQKR